MYQLIWMCLLVSKKCITVFCAVAILQFVERRVSNRKIANFQFDYELKIRSCVIGKDTTLVCHYRAKLSTRCGGPTRQKACQRNLKKVALDWCG